MHGTALFERPGLGATSNSGHRSVSFFYLPMAFGSSEADALVATWIASGL
jgi:hypothetical protein